MGRWDPKWKMKMGPCVEYDEKGVAIPDSGKTLDEMDIHQLRWYYDHSEQQVANGEFVAHNQRCMNYILELEPHVLTYDPVDYARPRKAAVTSK